MKTDTLPETWEEKLSSYVIGEERVYRYSTYKMLSIAQKAIDRMNKTCGYFRITITKTRFSIIREK